MMRVVGSDYISWAYAETQIVLRAPDPASAAVAEVDLLGFEPICPLSPSSNCRPARPTLPAFAAFSRNASSARTCSFRVLRALTP